MSRRHSPSKAKANYHIQSKDSPPMRPSRHNTANLNNVFPTQPQLQQRRPFNGLLYPEPLGSLPTVPSTDFTVGPIPAQPIAGPRARSATNAKAKKSVFGIILDIFKPNQRPKISIPYNSAHLTHVSFNSSTGEFTGLPKEWQQLLQESGISRSEQEKNPQAVMEIVKFYHEERGHDPWDKLGNVGGESLFPEFSNLHSSPPRPPPPRKNDKSGHRTAYSNTSTLAVGSNGNSTSNIGSSAYQPLPTPPVPMPSGQSTPIRTPIKPAKAVGLSRATTTRGRSGTQPIPTAPPTTLTFLSSKKDQTKKRRPGYRSRPDKAGDGSYPSANQHTKGGPNTELSSDDSDTHYQEDEWGDPRMVEVLDRLGEVLRVQSKRIALQSLKGARAQLLIDFLYFLISYPKQLPNTWLRKHALLALRKLSENSLLYPRCYQLKGIKYDPSSPVACGGFCDIFQVRHKNETVCLKVVRLYQTSDVTKVLRVCLREAILWGQLRHPNIVPFYGVYYLNDSHRRICLVSPWMDGGNITVYLQTNPEAARKPLVYDLTLGLEYLHNENVIHGDLKGMNVLVNGSGHACISDFGLSSIWTNKTLGFTATTVALGGRTDRWASPELLKDDGARPTRASDMWAFGCVCYEILTRLLPFHECSMNIQILRKLLNGNLPAQRDDPIITSPLDKVDQHMWSLMAQCWEAEPQNRPTCGRIRKLLEGMVGCVRDEDSLANGRLSPSSHFLQYTIPELSSVNPEFVRQVLERL